MKKRTKFLCIGIFSLSFFTASIAGAAQEGEKWEYKGSMDMMGTQMAIPPSITCQPANDKSVPTNSNCTVDSMKVNGDTTTFDITCNNPEPMKGSGSVTRTGDTMKISYKIKAKDMEMTYNMTGKKLGTCTLPQ